MKSVEKLLRCLERPEVEELALVSGRLPSARVGTSFDPLDEEPLSADSILAMLVQAGGSRYVDDLGPKPKQWAHRLPGVGNVTVSASQRGAQVLARFALASKPPSEASEATPPRPPDASQAGTRRPSRSGRPTPRASAPPPTKPAAAPAPGMAAQKAPTVGDGKRPSSPSLAARNEATGRGETAARSEATARSEALPRSEATAKAERAPDSPEAFRRAPTAPSVPKSRAREFREPSDLVLDTPSMDIPLQPASPPQPHVHVKTEKAAEWQPEATTQPATSVQPHPAGSTGAVDAFLEQAREAKATDLHLVAGRPVILRIGGQLQPKGKTLDADLVKSLVLPLVPLSLVPVLETIGSCDFAIEHPKLGRFRVNVGRQQTGLKACFRLVPRELPTLKGLGLPPELARATSHHQGLVVFTGPTGHGKTTTMTAVVDLINENTTHHIITVEDPVENLHPKKKALISQREVGTHTATFASALRAALREDPDVIVVGELRDVETVRMAVAASETGHLVLGTMNTPSAAKTIDRLIDLFPPADQPQVRLTLASGLRLIVGQRLVPSPDRSRVHAAIELLPGSIPLSAIIRDNKTFQIPSLQQRGKGFGIMRLDESLLDLVKSGRANAEDAVALAESPTEFEATLKGKPAVAAPGALPPR
jgi:twitching motility protein PilT